MSVVNAGHFGAGRITAAAASREQISGARMMAGNLPVVPSRASLSASGRAASPSTIRNGGPSRFYGSHNNIARPASFQHETTSLRQSMAQSHVGAIPAGGRSNGEYSARGTTGTIKRPSAGISTRESSSLGNRASSSSPSENRGGYRSFTPPSTANRSFTPERSDGGFGNSQARSAEPQRGMSQGSSASRDGFRPFTPPSGSQAARGASVSPSQRGGSFWNRTAPSSPTQRGYSEGFGRGSMTSRPQLDMHQPIVRGPSYGGSRGAYGGYGGYRPPSYGGSRPNFGGGGRAPSFGGGGHAPSGGGGHFGGGGGHPSGGGGHSGGGGGGHGGHR